MARMLRFLSDFFYNPFNDRIAKMFKTIVKNLNYKVW